MNLRRVAYRLQNALIQKGRFVKINQFQSYLPKGKRMITKYVLQEIVKENGRQKSITVAESCQIADIVKKLAEIYGGEAM